jgi:hypothetical protein
MRAELIFYFLVAAFCYTFYVSIGNVQIGVKKSLEQSIKNSQRMENVELKVNIVSDDVVEIKQILKKSGMWRKH